MSKKCGAPFDKAPMSQLYESHGHKCERSAGHKDSRHICRCAASSTKKKGVMNTK